MLFGYKNFRIKTIDVYSQFNPQHAQLIKKLCDSSIFPSGILITGEIGTGKSTFADVLASYYYRNQLDLYNVTVLYIDTPVDNSAQYCREILQQATRLIQIYNSRIFIIFDEAHILSFIAQQVFLASLEREHNLTICFVTNDADKICEAIQNRCLNINIESFHHYEHIQAFAAYVFTNVDNNVKHSAEDNYKKFMSMSISQTSARDIINSILYGDFSSYDNIKKINEIRDINEYVNNKIKNSEKININNLMDIIANYLATKECQCVENICKSCKHTNICYACHNINNFIKLSPYIKSTKSLQLLLKVLKDR